MQAVRLQSAACGMPVIRNVGRSGKGAGDRGRWGLGKIVYPAASDIRSFFCYSVQEGDCCPALIGRSVLAIHAVEDDEYVSEGYFCNFDPERPLLQVPEESPGEIEAFVRDFNITREPDQPGVSLVIPFPEASITYQLLVQCVIKSYFWEILRGSMEVEVVQGTQTTVISENSINDVVMSWAGLDEKERVVTQRQLEFCRKADRIKMADKESYFELSVPRSYGSPRMQNLFESEEVYEKARGRYRSGEIVALELKVSFRKNKTGEALDDSFLVYLQRDDELEQADETFIRDGLTIIGEGYIREAGVRALVLADWPDAPLNEFLGDAENPAHTNWFPGTKHFKGKYSPGKAVLEYIQRSALRLANTLGKVEGELLEDLLDDIFGISTEHDSRTREKKPNKRRGRKKPPKIEPRKRLRYVETSKLKNGFRVSRASDATDTPDRVVIKMAYEAEGVGKPFSEHHPADFNLTDNEGDLSIEMKGCRELRCEPNLLELSVEDASFSVSVVGFDPKRDLWTDAKPYVDKLDEEGEQ